MKNQVSQLVSILLLLLILVGSLLFVLPLHDKITALESTKETLAGELQGLEARYQELASFSEEVTASEATKNALKNAVPSGYDQEDLILELSAMAEDLKFTLNALSFSDSVDADFGPTLTVTANFDGSYDDLVAFLQKIEAADRLMRVTSMNVQHTSTSAVTFNLTIEAYYQ